MNVKTLVACAVFVALAPPRAFAHAEIIAGPDPVSAMVHFISQPDHIIGIAALGVSALLLSARFRSRAKAVLRRRARR